RSTMRLLSITVPTVAFSVELSSRDRDFNRFAYLANRHLKIEAQVLLDLEADSRSGLGLETPKVSTNNNVLIASLRDQTRA
ncbi:MAG: hypothetical protein SGI92_00240, partial [Bryobacteraceae bacterium]|nr:hypothetical protein [Bryobacteraceae bacterium]